MKSCSSRNGAPFPSRRATCKFVDKYRSFKDLVIQNIKYNKTVNKTINLHLTAGSMLTILQISLLAVESS